MLGTELSWFYLTEEEAEAQSVFPTAGSEDFWDFGDVWPRGSHCTACAGQDADPNPGARKNQKEKLLLGSSLR